MTQEELEEIHEALALAIDAVGERQSALFLAKLALALAETIGNTATVLAAIEECRTGVADRGRM